MSPPPPVPDPLALFVGWYDEAVRAGVHEADAMALATATPDGRPSVRFVLYRGLSGDGLRFFTNFESRKGSELEANPRAAVVFYWRPLDLQIRLEGRIERLGEAESDAYFASRPRGHQIAALASPQSRPVAHAELLGRYAELEARYAGQEVPRPAHWGGYRLIPERIERWERRQSRLHLRTAYTRGSRGWEMAEVGP